MSVASDVCNVLVRVISMRTSWWLERNYKFSETQYGFPKLATLPCFYSVTWFFLIRILRRWSTDVPGHSRWVHSVGMADSNVVVVPDPGDYDDGEFGGMKIGMGNRSTRRKPAPAPLSPPQIPLDQTRDRTRAATVGSQWLTAWAMARPSVTSFYPFNRSPTQREVVSPGNVGEYPTRCLVVVGS
jgi:hypothetical protein